MSDPEGMTGMQNMIKTPAAHEKYNIKPQITTERNLQQHCTEATNGVSRRKQKSTLNDPVVQSLDNDAPVSKHTPLFERRSDTDST